jgi:hypothetical protein
VGLAALELQILEAAAAEALLQVGLQLLQALVVQES